MDTSRAAHLSLLIGGLLLSGSPPAAAQAPALGERPPLPDAVELERPQRPAFESDTDSPPPPRWPQQQPVVAAPSNDKIGLRAGITSGIIFDDNIYARSTNKISDRIIVLRPELGADYRGPQFRASATAAVESRSYLSNPHEDHLNWGLNYAGIYAPRNDLQIQTRLGALQAHEQRGAADSQFFTFDSPVRYRQYDAALALNKRFDGWWTSVGGARSWLNYAEPTIMGIPIDQSYRNGAISVVTGRVGTVVAPLTSVFLDVTGNRRDFELDSFDSRGLRVAGGILFEPGQGARIRGEALAGYMRQNYTTFVDFSTFTYAAALAFRFDPRTVLAIDGRREAKESALAGGVSVLESSVNIRVDYQLFENFTVGAGVGYLRQLYAGPDRKDDTYGPLLSAKYFLNKHVTLGLDYRYIGFSSETAGVSAYSRNTVLLSLTGRL